MQNAHTHTHMQDDDLVLQRLQSALAAGPDPALDALTKCTGCAACGHEGGLKGKIKKHSGVLVRVFCALVMLGWLDP